MLEIDDPNENAESKKLNAMLFMQQIISKWSKYEDSEFLSKTFTFQNPKCVDLVSNPSADHDHLSSLNINKELSLRQEQDDQRSQQANVQLENLKILSASSDEFDEILSSIQLAAQEQSVKVKQMRERLEN